MPDHTDLTTRDMASKALTLIEQHLIDCANTARENRIWIRWIGGGVGATMLAAMTSVVTTVVILLRH